MGKTANVHMCGSAHGSRKANVGKVELVFKTGEVMSSSSPLNAFLYHVSGGKPSKLFSNRALGKVLQIASCHHDIDFSINQYIQLICYLKSLKTKLEKSANRRKMIHSFVIIFYKWSDSLTKSGSSTAGTSKESKSPYTEITTALMFPK